MFERYSADFSGLWLAPALLGLCLVLAGILLFVMPELLAYVAATVFVLAGGGLLGTAWRLRRRVVIRRVDETWSGGDPLDLP